MLWEKKKYTVNVSHGEGKVKTSAMFGVIQHIIVIPKSKDTVWSMIIKDAEQDIIYHLNDHEGRLDDKQNLPVGVSKSEELTIEIFDTTANEDFDVMFKIREAV